MKARLSNQNNFSAWSQNRAGMTLVEVIIALGIAVVTLSGIVSGYIYCMQSAVKAELAQAANAKALQRIEQARSAQWDISSVPVVDQLVSSNFSNVVVTLDMPGTNAIGITALIQTTISDISTTPPVKLVHVDCIWSFRGNELITNSIETCRAPD